MFPPRKNRGIPERFPNKLLPVPLFMFEGQRVLAGQAMVNQPIELAATEGDLLETAVRQHSRLVYRIAYSVLRNHHDAEDATQEVFIKVLRARTKLAEVQDPRNWLARIAWRVAVERGKKVKHVSTEEIATDQLPAAGITADEQLLGREMSIILEVLIPGLPPKLRDVITLSTIEDLSPPDVAKVLGISEARTRSRLFRARQILRERMTAILEGKHGRP
jgi:RNA polymerase sigma-70 factor (ECF subfamily)